MTDIDTNSSPSSPDVLVRPIGPHLVDDELRISVVGLPGLQEITIHTIISDEKISVESCCCYRADSDGIVDLHNQPSLSGSYTGASPMGIFWSMTLSPTTRKGSRLMPKNMEKPVVAVLSFYYGHLTDEAVRNTGALPVRTHTIERWYKGPGVVCQDVTEGRIRGKLYLPPGPGPFVGVIDMYGSTGGILEYRSALLASRGIAALALPYFRYKDLTENPEDLDLDYFIEAVRWMVGHQAIKGPKIGVVGISRGADIGYILAANCPEIGALVCISGCTFNPGHPIKFSGGNIPATPINYENKKVKEDAIYARSMFTYTEDDLTPVWRHNPKVLNIVGEDDAFNPVDCVSFMRDHYPRDKVDRFQILSYPGAGHLLEPPYTQLCSTKYHNFFGSYCLFGGEPKPHADAQEDYWPKMLKFLKESLSQDCDISKL